MGIGAKENERKSTLGVAGGTYNTRMSTIEHGLSDVQIRILAPQRNHRASTIHGPLWKLTTLAPLLPALPGFLGFWKQHPSSRPPKDKAQSADRFRRPLWKGLSSTASLVSRNGLISLGTQWLGDSWQQLSLCSEMIIDRPRFPVFPLSTPVSTPSMRPAHLQLVEGETILRLATPHGGNAA